MLDVGALIAFVAVIDTGSFSNAAQQLGQTPSGVSRTIARLEQQLGMTLIHRPRAASTSPRKAAGCWRARAASSPTWKRRNRWPPSRARNLLASCA